MVRQELAGSVAVPLTHFLQLKKALIDLDRSVD